MVPIFCSWDKHTWFMPQRRLLWLESTDSTFRSVYCGQKSNVGSETSQPSIGGQWNGRELQVGGPNHWGDLYCGHCTLGIVVRVEFTISIDIFDWKSTHIGNVPCTAYNSPDMTRNEVGPRPTLRKYLVWTPRRWPGPSATYWAQSSWFGGLFQYRNTFHRGTPHHLGKISCASNSEKWRTRCVRYFVHNKFVVNRPGWRPVTVWKWILGLCLS